MLDMLSLLIGTDRSSFLELFFEDSEKGKPGGTRGRKAEGSNTCYAQAVSGRVTKSRRYGSFSRES
jgi:hypothetical protein